MATGRVGCANSPAALVLFSDLTVRLGLATGKGLVSVIRIAIRRQGRWLVRIPRSGVHDPGRARWAVEGSERWPIGSYELLREVRKAIPKDAPTGAPFAFLSAGLSSGEGRT